ncbi:MAG: endonuclease III [Erysipelotrichaceae bacterium]
MSWTEILAWMEELFPNAECELVHHDAFTLLVAVALSAQTTDAGVNKVTPALFAAYPTPHALQDAKLSDVESYLKTIGLYRSKAANIIALSKRLVEVYDGEVPERMQDLITLPGVGRKTASVVRSVWFDIPSVPVDTHVERVSKRLKIAKESDDVLAVERKFKRKIPRDKWNKTHHLFIFFGRYYCTARNPKCQHCKLQQQCRYAKQNQ